MANGGLRRGAGCPNVGKNTKKVPSWMPFQWTKGSKVPNDFLCAGAPPQTISAPFTSFTPSQPVKMAS